MDKNFPAMKKLLKIVGIIILAALVIFVGFLAYITITDYRPKEVNLMTGNKKMAVAPIVTDTFNFMTWNIGYAGLGAVMDFFYDGGTKVRPTKNLVAQYLKGIEQFVGSHDSIDYFILSPNVKLFKVKTIDLNFANSDHNPVYMKVVLDQN